MNGLVGSMSCFDSRDELFSEFTRVTNSLGKAAVTAFFHYGELFFCEAGNTLFTFWTLEDVIHYLPCLFLM